MQQTQKEHLSALFDGELDNVTDFSEWDNQQETQAQFERYSLIRGVLKADNQEVSPNDFLLKVKSTLKDEPIVFDPTKKNITNKTYISLGLAASFLLVSVLVFTFTLGGNTDSAYQPIAKVETDDKTARVSIEETGLATPPMMSPPKAQLVTYGK